MVKIAVLLSLFFVLLTTKTLRIYLLEVPARAWGQNC